jgi:hypothetical protein
MLPVAWTTASNRKPQSRQSVFHPRFEQRAEHKSSLSQLAWWLYMYSLSYLHGWANNYKNLKYTIDLTHTTVISVTLLQYGHRISFANAIWIWNCLNFRKESKLTLAILINFIPWFWKDLHPATLEAPLWRFVQSTFSHAQGCCMFSVSAANLWTNQTHACNVRMKNKQASRLLFATGKVLSVCYFRNKVVMCLHSRNAR